MLFRLCTILFYKDSANGQIAKFTLTFYNIFCYNQIKSGVPFLVARPKRRYENYLLFCVANI